MPGPTDLFDAAMRILDVAVEALDNQDTIDAGLLGAPARQYVADGLPAFDCEQVTVHLPGLSEEITSPLSPNPATGSRHVVGRINLVTFVTTVVRCVPVSDTTTPPPAAAIENSARQIYSDWWGLWAMFYWRARDNTLLGGDRCEIRRFQASHIVDPSGEFGGSLISLQLQIDGYKPSGISSI